MQTFLSIDRSLVVFDGHEHPTRGPVIVDKQLAALGLVLHLGQLIHVHVQVPWLVELEPLVRLAGRLRLESVLSSNAWRRRHDPALSERRWGR